MRDVAVVGSGPAGLAAATACAERGLSVACVAPEPHRPWPNNYGAWVEELEALGLGHVVGPRWPRIRVRLQEYGDHVFERAYCQVNGGRLQAHLRGRAEAAGVRFVRAAVHGVTHHAIGSELHVSGRDRVLARLVIDATGHRAQLVQVSDPDPVAAQVAYGRRVRVHRWPFDPDEMLFMDLSDAHGASGGPPTFLYGMPFASNWVFVEETALVSRPPLDMDEAHRRLEARLDALGVRVEAVEAEERCFIPMGGPLPRIPQRVVGFGGAARMVHPATGYMMVRALGVAPRLAEAVERARNHAPHQPDLWAEEAWGAVWPLQLQRRWAVYRLGMEVLLDLDGPTMRGFFDAFFRIQPARWFEYQTGAASGRGVAAAMAAVFGRAPWRIRWAIGRGALSPKGLEALHALSL